MIDRSKHRLGIDGPALVVGASGAIGREVALSLATNGASGLMLTYGGGKEKTEVLAEEIREEFHIPVHVAQLRFPVCDDDEAAVKKLLDDGAKTVGGACVAMVNAAGISPNQPFAEQKIDCDDRDAPGWKQVFEVNLFSPVLLTRIVADHMAHYGIKGAITHITSTNGVDSQASFSAHYDTSKAALIHFIRTVAEDYAVQHGIRINGVAPGWVDTEMNRTVPNLDEEVARIWLGRMAAPHEIANVVTYVSGLGASYIVGQGAIMVDGGYPRRS